MIKNISTIRIGPWEKLEIDLAPHLNVFTGDNGFGKTYLLDLIWLLYSRHWKQAPASPRTLDESESDGTQTAPLVGNFTIEQFDYTVAAHYNKSAEQWQIQDNIQNRASSHRSPRADLVIYFGSEGNCLVWDSYRNIFPDEENWWSSHNDRERRYAFQLSPNELLNGLPYSNGQGML